MNELYSAIRAQFDALLLEYERRLQDHPGYAAIPPQIRQAIVRRIMDAVAAWAESGDDTALLESIRTMAQERAAHGRDIGPMQYAVRALDSLLEPLLTDLDTAKRNWRTFSKIQELLSHITTERLQTSETRLHQVMDRSPVGIFHATLEGAVTDANPAFFNIVGYESLADVERVGLAGLYADREAWQQLRAQATRGSVTRFEACFKHAGGHVIWVAIRVWLIQPPGMPPYLEGILEDITERRQGEEALREAEERFRTIYEGSNDALMLLRSDGFFDCNQRALEVFGCATKEEFVTKHPSELSPPTQPNGEDSVAASQAHIDRAYEQGYARFEWVHRRQDGVDFPAEVLLSAFELRGERVLQATVRDITRRERLEDQIRESLARRERQVRISVEIAQDIAAVSELDELLHRVVTQIKERFDYYHVQVFRYDPAQDVVTLITGYGEAGERMAAAGYTLPIGRGAVGKAAATRRSILVDDTAQAQDWEPYPDLPDTRGELAVPIKLRDVLLGILDVHSDRAGALSAEDQLLLEGLCGQTAVAMESTRLLEELRASQAELSEAVRIARLGYWEYDMDKEHFIFSDPFYNLFHTTAEREGGYIMSVAQFIKRFVYPDDAPTVEAEIEKAFVSTEQHFSHALDHRVLYADGGVGYVTTYINVERADDGRLLRFYGVDEDITERKQAEETMQETVRELERLSRATTREGWQTFLEMGELATGYRFDRFSVEPNEDVWVPEVEQAVQQNTLVLSASEDTAVVAPLTVRGEVIGALGVYDDPQTPLSPDELTLLQAIVEQGALALESARLYQDTQRRAAREQLIGEVTARVRETLDVDLVLQVAARELCGALNLAEVEVRLGAGPASEEA
ncbi:MAG: PAS domain S-box protein [Anaerolineae bacterium]|nr:PAS domain S-box protein [Anaerolineae bacterium]